MNACPACHGEGRVTVAGYSVSPFSGVPVCDPQEAHDEVCPACSGTGLTRDSDALCPSALPKDLQVESRVGGGK